MKCKKKRRSRCDAGVERTLYIPCRKTKVKRDLVLGSMNYVYNVTF